MDTTTSAKVRVCCHVINGGERCDVAALPGADYCRLHRGYIPSDPVPGSVGFDAAALDPARFAELLTWLSPDGLRRVIATQREAGFAFGPVAEACRMELARRGEQA